MVCTKHPGQKTQKKHPEQQKQPRTVKNLSPPVDRHRVAAHEPAHSAGIECVDEQCHVPLKFIPGKQPIGKPLDGQVVQGQEARKHDTMRIEQLLSVGSLECCLVWGEEGSRWIVHKVQAQGVGGAVSMLVQELETLRLMMVWCFGLYPMVYIHEIVQ